MIGRKRNSRRIEQLRLRHMRGTVAHIFVTCLDANDVSIDYSDIERALLLGRVVGSRTGHRIAFAINLCERLGFDYKVTCLGGTYMLERKA